MSTALADDPNVKIPAAVRAQAARSDAIIAQLVAEGSMTENDPSASPVVEVTTQGNANEPATILTPPANPVETAPDEGSWEHKYKSAHGRLLVMQQEQRKLTDQVSNLQNVLSEMTAPREAPEATLTKLITDEEENDYGKDLLAVVGKKAREMFEPLLAKQQAEIDSLRGATNSTAASQSQEVREKMLQQMDAILPAWREVNDNPEFLVWLALPDAFSGVIRHDMLKSAFAQNNGSRVLAFFNGFLSEGADTTPVRQTEPDTSTTIRVAKIPLANLAAPGKAKTSAASTGAPADKPYISRSQISSFYANVAAGKYRGRDAEKDAHEAQIFAAQAEGRITP